MFLNAVVFPFLKLIRILLKNGVSSKMMVDKYKPALVVQVYLSSQSTPKIHLVSLSFLFALKLLM